MQHDEKVAQALNLPTADYRTLGTARIKPCEVALIDPDNFAQMHMAKTNATSQTPVIGLTVLDTCLIVYNKRTKTAALTNTVERDKLWLDGQAFDSLVNEVRDKPDDELDIHVIGAAMGSDEGQNELQASYLSSVLESVETTPNATLKTFDVMNKPKPHSVAIDARNGKLVRGTELFITHDEETLLLEAGDLQDDFDRIEPMGEDFDGTVPELQNQRRR